MLAAITESHTAYSVEVSRRDNNEDFFVEFRLFLVKAIRKAHLPPWGTSSIFPTCRTSYSTGVEARGRDDWRPLSLDEVRKQPSKGSSQCVKEIDCARRKCSE